MEKGNKCKNYMKGNIVPQKKKNKKKEGEHMWMTKEVTTPCRVNL